MASYKLGDIEILNTFSIILYFTTSTYILHSYNPTITLGYATSQETLTFEPTVVTRHSTAEHE